MGKPSREKGKRGEREFSHLLQEMGFEARRAQQYCGAEGTADVLSSILGVHWEVKRYARIASTRFLDQAEEDALVNEVPVVAMREDRGPWTIQIRAKDLMRFVAKIQNAVERRNATSGG